MQWSMMKDIEGLVHDRKNPSCASRFPRQSSNLQNQYRTTYTLLVELEHRQRAEHNIQRCDSSAAAHDEPAYQ